MDTYIQQKSEAANRARRASLACISLGIPSVTSNSNHQQHPHTPRLPGKPTDVATRRRFSMTAAAVAASDYLDCPAFLRNGFGTTNSTTSKPATTNTNAVTRSSHSPTRGVARHGSKELLTSRSLRGSRGDSSHRPGNPELSVSQSRGTSSSHHGMAHKLGRFSNNNSSSHHNTNSSSHIPNNPSHRLRRTSIQTSSAHETNQPALTDHLVSRNSGRRARTSRSASMSSITKDMTAASNNGDNIIHGAAHGVVNATLTSSPRKGRRRNSLLATTATDGAANIRQPSRRQSMSQRRRTSASAAVSAVKESEVDKPMAAAPLVYEFDESNNHDDQDEDDDIDHDVEEFAGDNDADQEEAWPSPFETDDEPASANALAIVQKQRRQERQRMRNPAAAAASTILNTRKGKAPDRVAATTVNSVSLVEAPVLTRSSSGQSTTDRGKCHSEPHYRRPIEDCESPFQPMTSFGMIPLTEPKKEVLFTPSGHKRSLTASGHGLGPVRASDILLTPSLYKKPPCQDLRRAPMSATAALGSKSLINSSTRSKSVERFGIGLLLPDVTSPSPCPSKNTGNPTTPLTATSSSSKQSKTLSSRSCRSTLSTSSRDSSQEEVSSASKRLPSGSSLSARAAPGSRSAVARSKSMDQYTTRDFLLLSPLSDMPRTSKASPTSLSPLTSPGPRQERKVSANHAEGPSSRDTKSQKRSNEERNTATETKHQDDPSTTTTSVSSSDKNTSPKAPRRTVSSRTSRSRRASMGEDGKLHRHVRRSKEDESLAAENRLRRRQSFSHASATESRPTSTGMSRSSRRISLSSASVVDGGVTAVVATMSRMKRQSLSNSSVAASSNVHTINW